MAGVRDKPKKNGKYQGYYIDYNGRQRFLVVSKSKKKTLKAVEDLEYEHRLIRIGSRPRPTEAEKARKRDFGTILAEYMDWGRAQGGRHGKPWAPKHARNREKQLRWWQESLQLKTMADLDSVMPRIDKGIRALQAEGKSGKTIGNFLESIHAFTEWCQKRDYLGADVLKNLSRIDMSPKSKRRALTVDEIRLLLEKSAPHRRLLWEVALVSGLRANELRSLVVEDLDTKRCGVHLHAEWTKNRRDGFQTLPEPTVEQLVEFAKAGGAMKLYARYCKEKELQTLPPRPLLYVPSHTARSLDEDLVAAGIEKWTPEGKIDFHAFRTAFVTLVLRSGAGIKEAQLLARHSDARLTLNVYGRESRDAVTATVNRVGDALYGTGDYAHSMHAPVTPAVGQKETPRRSEGLSSVGNGSPYATIIELFSAPSDELSLLVSQARDLAALISAA